MEMPESEKQDFLKRIRMKYYRIRLELAYKENRFEIAEQQYKLLAEEGTPDILSKLMYQRMKYPLLEKIIRVIRIPWRMIVKLRGY